MNLEEIYNFIYDKKTIVPTIYEDEDGKHYGEIEALCDDDLYKVWTAIEDLLS